MKGTDVVEEVAAGSRISLVDRISRHPILAGATSGVFLWASFPPVEWSWLAWVALVPLFYLVIEPGPRLTKYLAAWTCGLVFWLASIQWVRLTDPSAWVAWVAMAGLLSAWPPVFLALARLAVIRLELPLILAAPILWVGLEYVRIFPLSGFPWYYLGHSQYRILPMIQISDVAGALGVSFLIATVNAWIVDLLTLPLMVRTPTGPRLHPMQRRRAIVVGAMLASTLLYGAYRLSTARFADGPRLALLQSNVPQRYKTDRTETYYHKILADLESLVEKASRQGRKPDLIVWPETSYPYGYITIDPSISDPELGKQLPRIAEDLTPAQWRETRRDVDSYLRGLTDLAGAPMLVGSILYEHKPKGLGKYNAAILFQPRTEAVQAYRKMQLVPFGEYVPFLESMPWLMVFTPYRNGYVPSLQFGQKAESLDVKDRRVAVGICFEDTVPHLIRRFFEGGGDGRQPDVLVDLSNDGWFQGSSELDMHLAVSVFRCVENRVPLARAVNTGLSALIDGDGRILRTLPRLTQDVLLADVPLDPRTSFYSAWGDWLGLSCLAVCIGLGPVALLRHRLTARRAG